MEKTERGRIQGLPKFMQCSQLSQERLKLMNFKFGRNIRRLNPSKRPLKFWRQEGVGVVRDCAKFSGQQYTGWSKK